MTSHDQILILMQDLTDLAPSCSPSLSAYCIDTFLTNSHHIVLKPMTETEPLTFEDAERHINEIAEVK